MTKAEARRFRGANTTTRKGTRYRLTVFPTSTDYFGPAPFMIDYIVDDLDAARPLKTRGVKIDAKRMNESFGRFA